MVEEVHRVLKVICEAFNRRQNFSFWFYGADQGEVGNFPDMDEDVIQFESDGFPSIEYSDEHSCSYGCEFPFYFLFKNEKEIREIIEGEIKAAKDGKEARKKKAKESRDKRMSEKAKVLKKLTKEERKALGV